MSPIQDTKVPKWLVVLAILSVLYALTSIIVQMHKNQWPTGDEHWHYSYSERLLDKGLTERASIHNYNSTTPGTILNVLCQDAYTYISGDRSFSPFFARLPQIGWYLLLLLASFSLSAKYFGPKAKWLTLIFISLDANLQAHTTVIGTDIQFAATTIVVLKLASDYWTNPKLREATKLGLKLGLAFIAKYSASLLVAPIILLTLLTSMFKRHWLLGLTTFFGHIAAIGLCTIMIVNLSYGFIGFASSFSEREWYYSLFKYLAVVIPNLPLPLPIDFISGFDHQLAAERTWDWNGIMLGQELKSGVWYFFILTWLVKTPIALLLVMFLSVILLIMKDRQLFKNPAFICAALLFIFFLSYFSFVFRVHVGLRYTLMCIPIGYILAAAIIGRCQFNRLTPVFASILILFSALELRPYFGNSLAFTNLMVWPKETVYQWIADSNIDWNQNHRAAKDEADRTLGQINFNPAHILPGYNLITVNHLTGVYRNTNKHRWVRDNLHAAGHFGYTTILFDVSPTDFKRFMAAERTFSQPEGALGICHPAYRQRPLNNGSLALSGSWTDQKLYTACLIVEQQLTVEVKVSKGRAYIGPYPAEHNCQGLEVGNRESLWFNFKPGVHPICANVVQDLLANWTIHSGQAKQALRIQP